MWYIFGTIDLQEVNEQSISSKKDIFMIIEEKDGEVAYRYYDEKQDLIGITNSNGQTMLEGNFSKELQLDVDSSARLMGAISQLKEGEKETQLSLSEVEAELEEYAKALGISKEQLLSAVTMDLDQDIGIADKDREAPKEDKLDLEQPKEEDLAEEKVKQNQDALEHISAKSEVDLDKKVTGKQTLGQILGVPAGGKLIAVYSEHIANNKNTAEFSFLLQKPDGSLELADMLGQVNGNRPNKDIASVNYDGSEIKDEQVNSLYSIDSTSDTHDMLSIKRGSLGVLELSYVQMDPTDNTQGMSIPLETNSIRPVTSEVRNEMNHTQGSHNIADNLDEYETHKNVGCKKVTLEEANGEKDGHHHLIDGTPEFEQFLDEIMAIDEIAEVYNRNDVKKMYFEMTKDDPNISFDELTDQIKEMAGQEHEGPGHNRH